MLSLPLPLGSRRAIPHLLSFHLLLTAALLGPHARASEPTDAPPLVSPEIVLELPNPGPAELQRLAAAAGEGQSLVVWLDRRAARPQIYGARVAPDGSLLEPLGFLVMEPASHGDVGSAPAVAFDGAGYLVVSLSCDSGIAVCGARVSPGGAVLDPAGFPIAPSAPGAQDGAPVIAWNGASYLVAWPRSSPSGQEIRHALVSPAGAVLGAVGVLPMTAPGALWTLDVASDGDGFLLAWYLDDFSTYEGQVQGARLSAQGALLDPAPISIGPPAPLDLVPRIAATYNGGRYVVAWAGQADMYQGELRTARVTPQGGVLDPGGVPLAIDAESAISGLAAARVGSQALIAWGVASVFEAGLGPLRVAAVDPGGGLGPASTLPLAPGGDLVLAGHSAGALLAIAEPRVPGPGFYVDDSFTVAVGARLDAQGELLDPAAFDISRRASTQQVLSAASGAEGSFVLWSEVPDSVSGRQGLYGARLSPEGEVLDPAPISISSTPISPYTEGTARVVFDGSHFVVVWSDEDFDNASAVRVGTDGLVLDADPIAVPSCIGNYNSSVALASDGARTLGAPLDRQPITLVTVSGPLSDVLLSADGAGHLLVWQQGVDGLFGLRLTPDGEPLDPAPLPLTAASSFDTGGSGTGCFNAVGYVDGA